GLHHGGGALLTLPDHGVGGAFQRAAADHGAARAVGAAADRHLRGVALHVPNLLERNAEPFVGQLRKYGGVALAVRMGAAIDGERAGWIEAHLHAVVEDTAELDVEA